MKNLKKRVANTLSEIKELFDYRHSLLKKDTLNDNETAELLILNDFIDDLPFSTDSEVCDGFDKIIGFAKKIGSIANNG